MRKRHRWRKCVEACDGAEGEAAGFARGSACGLEPPSQVGGSQGSGRALTTERFLRTLLLPIAAAGILGASMPETRFAVALPVGWSGDASGRLLMFLEPKTSGNERSDIVDVGNPDGPPVFVAARDLGSFGENRTVLVDAGETVIPHGIAELPPGLYRVQAVLDRDGSYSYGGRGPGDLVSKVLTVRLPLESAPSLVLSDVLPPEPAQFDVTGLPPRAAEQILSSQPHLHEERIASPLLTAFSGCKQTIAAWVLTPPGYDPQARRTYPTVFTAGGFGATHKLDGQQLSRQWHLMEAGEIPPMIWVALDYGRPTGTTEFADSVNNGPWGKAFTADVLPALEARYKMDARPSGRFLTGHSSGGWFALWTMVRNPTLFGGAWASSPDPVDFHDFLGVDLYAKRANMYRDASGAFRPMERRHGNVRTTVEQGAALEQVLGRTGGQLSSFEWVFSPRGADGRPDPLFDRGTGEVDPQVAAYWTEHFDLSRIVAGEWRGLKKHLDGKLHVSVGDADSYYLDGPVRRLEAAVRSVGGHADFTYVPGATHSMGEVYARGGDRNALWKEMTSEMYSVARPRSVTGRAASSPSKALERR